MKTLTLIITVILVSSLGLYAQLSNKDSSSVTITKGGLPDKVVNLKLFLEGLYDGYGTMHPAMDESGYHFGVNIADTLTVELHHEDTIYAEVIYTANNVSLYIGGTATFPVPASYNGNYYITVKQRNHILTVSTLPVSFTGPIISYDFESAATQAYGDNMLMIDYSWVFYTGDQNQDGIVDATDLSEIENESAFASIGYIPEDLNGDGLVDGSDLSFAGNNATLAIASITPLSIPIVSTSIVTNIASTTATSGGNVLLDGGALVSARGVCWSTSPNPTTADNHTFDGILTGTFVSHLIGLTANTFYYVRAYATNILGTAYGNDTTFTTLPLWACGSPIIDTRDGQAYNTVMIGNQCWMAQNLNTGTRVSGSTNQTNNSIIEKYCYNDLESNCDIYGGLYQWNEMMDYTGSSNSNPSYRQGICPPGWHVPSDAEWCQVETYLDATVNCTTTGWHGYDAGGRMKETGLSHWHSPNAGAINSSGFTALPGGNRYYVSGGYSGLLYHGYFGEATESSSSNAWFRYLYNDSQQTGRANDSKAYGFSLRCLKD
jgi:uncharacterized protein (TIGR02145 family)